MQDIVRRLNPITFGLAALCFLLSFAEMNDRSKPEAVSGIALVVHSVTAYIDSDGTRSPELAGVAASPNYLSNNELTTWPSALSVTALIATLIAFGLAFVAKDMARKARFALAGVALISLILLRVYLGQTISGFEQDQASVEGGVGLWMAIGFYLGGLVINLVREEIIDEQLSASPADLSSQDIESGSTTGQRRSG